MTTEKQIQHYKTGLCEGNAYWMARLAEAVYTHKGDSAKSPDDTKILADLKAEDDKFISVQGCAQNSAQAALIEHEKYLCMAFRGTDEPADWLDNINAFPTQEMFGHFHTGFYRSLEDVWTTLYGRYLDLKAKEKRPLFITGHSLGGAMATIAAARFVHMDKPFTSVYTFGQPRAMSRETVRIFNAECKGRFFRFQNNNDIVTRIPARLMGYGHVGQCIYIDGDGDLHDDPGYWFKFLDAVEGAIDNIKEKGLDMINDHSMPDYLGAVKNWKDDDLEIQKLPPKAK